MRILKYWKKFYHYSGISLVPIILIAPLIGLLDGLGLTVFIPVLTSQLGNENDFKSSLPKFVYELLDRAGIEYGFVSIIAFFFGLIILKNFLRYTHTILIARVNSNFVLKVRLEYLEKLKELNYIFFQKLTIGYIFNNVTSDTMKYSTTQRYFIYSLSSMLILSGYFFFLLYNSWKITLVMSILGYFLAFLYSWLNKKAKYFSRLVVKANKSFSSIMFEIIHNYKYLKATDGFKFAYAKANNGISDFAFAQRKTTIFNGLPSIILEPATIIIVITIVLLNQYVLMESISTVVVIIAIAYRTSGSLNKVQNDIQQFYSGIGSLEEVEKTLEAFTCNSELKTSLIRNNRFKNHIKLEGVNFFYDGSQILRDINLEIPARSVVAFVGPSGSGKSTLVDIICGLQQPSSGTIFLDDIGYRNLVNDDWRRSIGYIAQDPSVFSGTILDNIVLDYAPQISQETEVKIYQALKQAALDDFISDSDLGLYQGVGDKGSSLSGGQRQRLAIAREIFKRPDFFILDEATSALDSSSEKRVQEGFDEIQGTSTIVIIAHRLATIKNADIIYVMDRGEIIDSGTYEELMNKDKSMFKDLALKQNLI